MGFLCGLAVAPGDELRASTTEVQQRALMRVVGELVRVERDHGRVALADGEWEAVLVASLRVLEGAHPGTADELLVRHTALCLAWLQQMEEARATAQAISQLEDVGEPGER